MGTSAPIWQGQPSGLEPCEELKSHHIATFWVAGFFSPLLHFFNENLGCGQTNDQDMPSGKYHLGAVHRATCWTLWLVLA